ncbi:CCN_G0037550.mRNA.1.CDS.1 [Saccharomyces cerevisiae]|nr:CCN_G0037550.mRNA.1.CDS.1 [Saccharomyces cerevisiae]CAI7410613.1 CCN_G0037550.mRNA.1.CDS.1 [Saccharomyces cerevisiae]
MLKLRQLQKKKKKENENSSSIQPNLSAARIRLKRDLDSLDLPPTVTLNVITSPDSADRSQSPKLEVIVRPDEGYYNYGSINFNLDFNEVYPIEPPKVVCLKKIFHPNIDLKGNVCLNILREDWSPALDLQSIITGLLFLFLEPNPNDPLNKDAAKLLCEGEKEFAEAVRLTMSGGSIEHVKYDNIVSP